MEQRWRRKRRRSAGPWSGLQTGGKMGTGQWMKAFVGRRAGCAEGGLPIARFHCPVSQG